MGIIRAAVNAVHGSLADQWLETVEPYEMGEHTVFTEGILVRKGQNKKGSQTISNGSVIHVYDNQFMMLVDGGKIIDYTAEPGYFTVDQSSSPSMFSGSLDAAVKDTFERLKFGGQTPHEQRVFYINLQEIKGIKFGTRNPVNYFDQFYNAELFLRAHGSYSIRIVDPLRFYAEAVPRNASRVEIEDINEQYMNEFLEGLQSSINQMAADGIRISFAASKSAELSRYMADAMDESWRAMRGMEIQSVAIASLSYDEASQKLIQMRNEGAMMSDPSIREGYVQGAMARSMEKAAANPNGAMNGFMGMGMAAGANGMNAQNLFAMGQQPAAPQQQTSAADSWKCSCGATVTGKFCPECGSKKPEPKPAADSWTCSCGATVTGKFCPECGKPRPAAAEGWTCSCGAVNKGRFCSECGKPKPAGTPKYKCDKCGWEPEDPAHPPKFCPECGDPFDDSDRT